VCKRQKLIWDILIIVFLLSHLVIISAYAEKLRDPTRPIKIEDSATNGDNPFTIRAIIISPTTKIALTDDRVLAIGDEIMRSKIIDIQANSVKLQTDSGEIVDVSMFDTILKKTVDNKENKS
jgi:hypothetical protein